MMLSRILDTVLLPAEISDFERTYLARVNRIGLVFFILHIPIFTLVAAFNDTGPVSALTLTGLAIVGPLIAFLTFRNPRHVSITYGFTAMVMGALLVHFGQGPVQIEMHFYFFALLAMLALYGNPMVIITAAVTVAVHHLAFWLYLPKSVFNYEAPVWVVAVHAAFVVLESIATCYIARSFFENVIGLEKIVTRRTAELATRNRELKLILDNVDQGFVTIDTDGVMAAETSAIIARWFGPTNQQRLVDYLAPHAPEVSDAFDCGWDQVTAGILPLELGLAQLPSKMTVDDKHFEINCRPIALDDGESFENAVVVISDVTAEVQRAELEVEQRETVKIFDRLMQDRRGFLEFYEEAEDLVEAIASDGISDLRVLKRVAHTLKGNAALFGVDTVADICHRMESMIVAEAERPSAAMREQLSARWQRLASTLTLVFGDSLSSVLEVDVETIDGLLDDVRQGAPRAEIAGRIERLKLEPTSKRLERVAEQTARIADRLGKSGLVVTAEDNDLYLDPKTWAPFWSSFVHVVRNAVDHGVESVTDRESHGKPANGTITLRTHATEDAFVIEASDDGPGIDLDAVKRRAIELGLPADSESEVLDAVFADGLSTASQVSEFSGRGVGLSAVRQACEQLAGRVEIESQPGRGATVRFLFPRELIQTTRPVSRPVSRSA